MFLRKEHKFLSAIECKQQTLIIYGKEMDYYVLQKKRYPNAYQMLLTPVRWWRMRICGV